MKNKGTRVVVTGAKGFTGVSIVKEFRSAGYDVLGIDIKPHEWAEPGYKRIDLTDGAAVHDAFAGADAVVHFGSYPEDDHYPWNEVYRNVALGGFNVFQACANLGIKRIAYASSPMVYGHAVPASVPADENRPIVPLSIYGAVKENLESLARGYCRWFALSIAALRTNRIVYENSFNWRFRKFTLAPEAASDELWGYVDARDIATACRLWIESDHQGFEAFDVNADDVCVDVPTMDLIRHYLPATVKVTEPIDGFGALVPCTKLRQMLGWKPRYVWRDLQREAEQRGESAVSPSAAGAKV